VPARPDCKRVFRSIGYPRSSSSNEELFYYPKLFVDFINPIFLFLINLLLFIQLAFAPKISPFQLSLAPPSPSILLFHQHFQGPKSLDQ
jgi:hypothetical protein